jgi:hypothetical protein
MKRSALVPAITAISMLAFAAAQPAAAQSAVISSPAALRANAAQAAKPCPAGQSFALARISTIKPNGSVAGYKEAVRGALKWYRDHGHADSAITVYPVVDTPDQGKSWAVSKTQVLTIQMNRPALPKDNTDPTWDAVRAKFRANSDIASDIFFCTSK